MGLVQLFREAWPRISGRTAVEVAELDRAAALASELLTGVGLRQQAPALIGEAQRLRQQAFTLFVQAYDEARRAIGFLRWHTGDAGQIAPSLYSGRRRRVENVVAASASAGPTPVQPVGLPGSNPFTV